MTRKSTKQTGFCINSPPKVAGTQPEIVSECETEIGIVATVKLNLQLAVELALGRTIKVYAPSTKVPGWRRGFSSIFEFGTAPKKTKLGSFSDDLNAMANDFNVVGSDIRSAIASYKKR